MKTFKIDSDNYFDIAEAVHCFLTLNHDGQWSDKYRALCASEFKPGPLWSESRVETENPYYSEITEENWEETNKQLTDFLETRQ